MTAHGSPAALRAAWRAEGLELRSQTAASAIQSTGAPTGGFRQPWRPFKLLESVHLRSDMDDRPRQPCGRTLPTPSLNLRPRTSTRSGVFCRQTMGYPVVVQSGGKFVSNQVRRLWREMDPANTISVDVLADDELESTKRGIHLAIIHTQR